MTEYKPGTVAVATVRGVPNVRVFLTERAGPGAFDVWRHTLLEGCYYSHPNDVTDIRPLVVLDIDADNVAHALRRVASAARVYGIDPEVDVARQIADEIEEQTKPPRIPEPGMWGVVEASLRGDEKRARLHYVRTDARTWTCVGGARRSWSELVEPVLVREGVE